ncbi:MAG: DUF2341 domain-containing protein, partial [Thermoplasmatales archaeon]|nr:DUF2341 domain-containing protein [Thermoplasmatales archaeon]
MVKWAYKPKNKENLIGKTVLICMIVMTLLCPTIMETMGSSEGVKNLEQNKTTKSLDSLYNPEWQYRKPITITENSNSDLTDYQVLIEVDTASLVSEGKMQPDGDDIRFTDQDGNELSYWIEHFDNLKYNEPDDYVASWSMDEGAGSTVYDNSPNNNDGTINGASWTSGKFDDALSFDGINDYVGISNTPTLSSLTLEGWINLSDASGVNQFIEFNTKTGCTETHIETISDTSEITFVIGDTDGILHRTNSPSMSLNTWHHVVGTYDGNEQKLYIDGNLVDSVTWSGTPAIAPGCTIGRDYEWAAQYWTGTIDEVRIHNRALSADEIKSIYEEKSKLWVKVPSIPANEETIVYMYYGNPGASSVSDGDVTFDFFDDFEDNIYTDKWKLLSEAHGWDNDAADVSESNGNIWIRGDWSDKQFIFGRQMSFTGGSKYKIMLWLKGVSTGNGKGLGICPTKTDWSDTWIDACKYWTDGNDPWVWLANIPVNRFQKYTVEYLTNTGTLRIYEEDTTLKHERTDSTWSLSSAHTYTMGLATGNEHNEVRCGLYAVRKYTSPEPTIIIGLEEEISLDFWYDTFIDTSKIDCMENVTVENGDVKLAPGEFTVDEHTVALWHFNEGSGTTTYDETPNDNDGTINGATWTTGKFGSALSFDGDGDYVEIPDSDSFNMVSWTIEAWIKIPYTGNEGRKIIVIQHEGSSQKYWYMALSSNNLELGYCLGVGDPYCIVESYNQPLNDGVWHHVAGVKSGGNYLKWYIDGINVKTLNITDNRTYALSTDVWIGGFWWVDDQYFNGTIDEIRISNIARTKFDYYQTFGTLTSEKIHVPTNKTWNTLYINKTEPQNTHLKVSVLDGENNQTITEYENMNQTTISLSGINPVEHPTIRLKTELTGNGTTTPLLHFWSVNWTNISGDVDLTLNSSDITFSEMDEDGNITINALIHNIGNNTAQNIGVRFLINSLQIGNDQTIDSIPGNSSENTNTVWTPMNTGTHTITITIDPNNLIPETNETNNNANKNIDVPAYYSVELNLLSSPTQSINSGESATYAIAVHNLGNTNDTVNLGISGKTAGWDADLNTNSVFLTSKTYQYNSTTVALTVTAPSDADINEVATITVTGTSHGNNEVKDETTTVTIANPTNNIFLTCINNNTHHINPDTSTTYTLLLINYGNETETDNINIDYSESAAGWIVELKQNNIPLGYENY